MADKEQMTAIESDDAEWPLDRGRRRTAASPTELLRRFKADLLQLALREDYCTSGWVVALGCLDVAEGFMRRAVRLDPSPVPGLLARIDGMRDAVQRVGETFLAAEDARH